MNANDGGMNLKQSVSFLLFFTNKKHMRVIEIISKIENEIESALGNCNGLERKEIKKGMTPIRDRDTKYTYDHYDGADFEPYAYKINGVKATNNKCIYLKGSEDIKYTFDEAVKQGFLGKGSVVKALIGIVGVWDCGPFHSTRYLKWSLSQMLITRESDDNVRKRQGCPIIVDDDY